MWTAVVEDRVGLKSERKWASHPKATMNPSPLWEARATGSQTLSNLQEVSLMDKGHHDNVIKRGHRSCFLTPKRILICLKSS